MSKQQKQKKLSYLVTVSIIAATAGLYFVSNLNSNDTELTTLQEDVETAKTLEIAKTFVLSSPTFSYDGILDSLDLVTVNTLESHPVQHVIEFTFESSHSGFGNREDQMLAQVITTHTMSLIISDGQVISAVTDKMWDEQNNQYVLKNPQSKLPSSNEPVLNFNGQVTDYQTLVTAIKSRGLAVSQIDQLDDSPFSTNTLVLLVSGITLQVYIFDSESDVKKAKELVSADGTQIGLSVIRWMDVPHFYNQGTIIVQYVGDNPEMINLLDSLLGKQFAGM